MMKRLSALVCQSKVAGTALVIGMSAPLFAGCAMNLCATEPEDPHCIGPGGDPVGGMPHQLSVSPARLSLSQGGALTVKLGTQPAAGAKAFLRRAMAADLTLGSVEQTEQSVTISAAQLSGRTPGLAQLVVVLADHTELTAPLRLFMEPAFRDPPKEYDTKTESNYPLWVGIGDLGAVYTLNSFPPFMGSTDRQLRLVDYQYTKTAFALRSPQSFGAYRGYPISAEVPGRGAMIGDQIVAISKNPVSQQFPILTDLCSVKAQTCRQLNPMTIEFQKLLGLAADQHGALVAVQTDTEALVFRGTEDAPFVERLSLTGAPANKGALALVAVGDLDGDTQPDLVQVHQGGGASVFLRATDSKVLRYSEPYSQKLGAALGGLPTALAVGDLDGDGLDDVVLGRSGSVTLLLNQADGGFTATPALATGMVTAIDSIALGNIDSMTGNRSTDLAVASSTGQRLALLINQAAF